ncbi:hypothetical protein Tco_0686220 [Tanacetum coccineum]
MANDQPMWGNNQAVEPTPGAAILAVDLRDTFIVKGHHLSMIKDRKFDGHARADPHKHITEFFKICGVIATWEQMREAFVLWISPRKRNGRKHKEMKALEQEKTPVECFSNTLFSMDIEADVLEDIEADATAVEVAVDRDVEAEVEDEVESSDRGTMEVGVDVVAGIDIPDDVEESLQDIYDHARSLIAGGERASLLEQVASLERSNARLRGTMMMERARADRFRRRVRFIESELRQIRRFRYYDRMRFRRLETFAARRLGFRP